MKGYRILTSRADLPYLRPATEGLGTLNGSIIYNELSNPVVERIQLPSVKLKVGRDTLDSRLSFEETRWFSEAARWPKE